MGEELLFGEHVPRSLGVMGMCACVVSCVSSQRCMSRCDAANRMHHVMMMLMCGGERAVCWLGLWLRMRMCCLDPTPNS